MLHELLRLVLSVCPVFIGISCKGQYINHDYLSICYLSTPFKMRLFYFFIDWIPEERQRMNQRIYCGNNEDNTKNECRILNNFYNDYNFLKIIDFLC